MLSEGAEASEAALKRYCLAKGPAYAHPRRILLVEEMPLSGAAKVDRLEVQRRLTEFFGPDGAEA
jgi:long-chain acyl-CoA synthetase